MWKFDDARMPTEVERMHLSRIMYLTFVDMRALLLSNASQQAKDLADAFHNIPLLMHSADFSFSAFRTSLNIYQDKHQGRLRYNYLQEWEKLNTATP